MGEEEQTSHLVTVRDLRKWLADLVEEDPALDDHLVATADDPEGNGFHLVNRPSFAFEKIGESYGSTEAVGRPVLIVWAGYPAFEVEEGEDDDD